MRTPLLKSLICFLISLSIISITSASEKQLVIRQAKEDSKGAAAVEAYLDGDVMEVKASVRMTEGRPTVENVIIQGTKLGTIVPVTVKQIYASGQEEPPYETTTRGGFISFNPGAKSKRLKGGVSRKLATFNIPKDKIVPGGKYYIKVKINSAKQSAGKPGKSTRFKFDISNIIELIH